MLVLILIKNAPPCFFPGIHARIYHKPPGGLLPYLFLLAPSGAEAAFKHIIVIYPKTLRAFQYFFVKNKIKDALNPEVLCVEAATIIILQI
jgi:hypothetical protein